MTIFVVAYYTMLYFPARDPKHRKQRNTHDTTDTGSTDYMQGSLPSTKRRHGTWAAAEGAGRKGSSSSSELDDLALALAAEIIADALGDEEAAGGSAPPGPAACSAVQGLSTSTQPNDNHKRP